MSNTKLKFWYAHQKFVFILLTNLTKINYHIQEYYVHKYYASMAELADALDLGSSGQPWGFKSLCSHQIKKKSIGFFLFIIKLNHTCLRFCLHDIYKKRIFSLMKKWMYNLIQMKIRNIIDFACQYHWGILILLQFILKNNWFVIYIKL